jgi:glycosyltransferase involved in cell wall biosynthesis
MAGFTKKEENRLMRVIHVFKTFSPDTYGGIEQVIKTLADHTQKLGVENKVLVLTPGQPRVDKASAGYEVKRFKQNLYLASTGFSISMFTSFTKEIAWADIVHMHFPWPFADVCYLASKLKKPTVLSFHSDVVNQVVLNKLYAPLRNHFFSKIDIICAASPGIIQSSTVLRQFDSKVRLITYGIEHFPKLAIEDEVVQRWRKLFGSRFFLFLGSIRYYKGLHILIEALRGRDYPTVLVGSGRELDKLKAQVSAAGLQNIHFIAEVNELEKRSIMRAAYGFVFPSHLPSEAFGIALVEAAQQGTPMITCEIGTGTSYVNLHDETGLVVAPSDPLAFGAALDVFWQSPDQVKTWGFNAINRYEKNFRAETMAESYLNTYESVFR